MSTPVYALFLISNSLFPSSGATTGVTFNLYFVAKSKSLWSWAGQPKIALSHNPLIQSLQNIQNFKFLSSGFTAIRSVLNPIFSALAIDSSVVPVVEHCFWILEILHLFV